VRIVIAYRERALCRVHSGPGFLGTIRKRTEHAVTHGMATSEQGQQRIARLELREQDDVIHVT